MTAARLACLVTLLLVSGEARAQEGEPEPGRTGEAGPHYVFGLGGAFVLDPSDQRLDVGGNAFFQLPAIGSWLTMKATVSVVKTSSGADMYTGLMFETPLRLRKGIELLVGAGPEIVETLGSGTGYTYYGVEGVLDFRFWPSRDFGVWVAPTYDLVFRDRATLGFGGTIGPMIRW
jgi:hypothetical protein